MIKGLLGPKSRLFPSFFPDFTLVFQVFLSDDCDDGHWCQKLWVKTTITRFCENKYKVNNPSYFLSLLQSQPFVRSLQCIIFSRTSLLFWNWKDWSVFCVSPLDLVTQAWFTSLRRGYHNSSPIISLPALGGLRRSRKQVMDLLWHSYAMRKENNFVTISTIFQ